MSVDVKRSGRWRLPRIGSVHLREQLTVAAWVVIAWFALLGGVYIFRYVTGSPDHYDLIFRHKYLSEHTTVLIHGMAGVLALVTGPFQFWATLRKRAPVLHRMVGFVYLVSVAVASTTGLPMGLRAFGGTVSCVGFCVMSVVWFSTAWLALVTARRRDFAAHRLWMLRNYALTFGAVQLRIYLFAFQAAGIPFVPIYPYVSWLAWVPNLIVVEQLFGCFANKRLKEISR